MIFGKKQADAQPSRLEELKEQRSGVLAWVEAGAGCTADRDLLDRLDTEIAALEAPKAPFNAAAKGVDTSTQQRPVFGRRGLFRQP